MKILPLWPFCAIIIGSLAIGSSLGQNAVTQPNTSVQRSGPPPEVYVTREEAAGYFRVRAVLDKQKGMTIDDFEIQRGGRADLYSVKEIENYKPTPSVSLPPAIQSAPPYRGPKEFPWVHVRRSFKDILASEDPSLLVSPTRKFDDLEGALISFARDFVKDTDTWATQGALIAPFAWATGADVRDNEVGLKLVSYGFTPSLSFNRVSTSGDPKNEIDQWIYRVGGFAKWEQGNAFRTLTFRGYGSYATDFQHETATPALELELEPQFDFSQSLRIGYRTIVIAKPEKLREDMHDTAWVAYQARLIVHAEYGAILDRGDHVALKEEEFFRLGPIAQFDLKPLFHPRLGLSFRCSYLPALMGDNDRDILFTADAEWILIKPDEKRRKLALKISYLRGGLDLTKQDAETLLIGLGVTF